MSSSSLSVYGVEQMFRAFSPRRFPERQSSKVQHPRFSDHHTNEQAAGICSSQLQAIWRKVLVRCIAFSSRDGCLTDEPCLGGGWCRRQRTEARRTIARRRTVSLEPTRQVGSRLVPTVRTTASMSLSKKGSGGGLSLQFHSQETHDVAKSGNNEAISLVVPHEFALLNIRYTYHSSNGLQNGRTK